MSEHKNVLCPIENYGYEAFEKVIDMIGGKWKLRILYVLTHHEFLRNGDLRRKLTPITHKMMSMQLKDLENDGLIIRKEYPQIPPKVEYSLSEKGWALVPTYEELAKWIMKYYDEFELL